MMPTLLAIEALEADRRHVERQLSQTDDSPWGTARIMWQNRLSEIKQQLEEVARERSNYATVALIFDGNPVIGSGDIRLDFTTETLGSYQRLVTLALATRKGSKLSERGRLPSSDDARLYIRDLVRGSMGFILEEIAPEQQAMVPSLLKDAVESTTDLISNLNMTSDENFESVIAEVHPRMIAEIHRFTSILHEFGASTRIIGDDRHVSLSNEEIGRLSRRLDEVEISEETQSVTGVLLGILPEARRFELRIPDSEGPTIQGTVPEELATKYTSDGAFKERLLLKPVNVQIKITQTKRNGRVVRERRELESVEPV